MTQIVKVNVTQTVASAPSTLQQCGALVSQGATTTSPGTSSLLTQLSDLTPLLTGAKAVTSMAWSSGTVSVTTTTAHGFTIGDTLYLTIAGVTPAGYNGTYLCTVTGASTFTYPLTASPGTVTIQGAYTPEDVAELLAMATTHFAQGSNLSVYVLELGPGNANDGVAALTAYITANPNSNYTPGAAGFFYLYVVPRTWDANANFLAMLASFESTTAKTYFMVTTTLSTYASYGPLMKCVISLVESPAIGTYLANALTAITWSSGLVTATTTVNHGVAVGQWFQISGVTPSAYNGWWQAQIGTTGTTLVYSLATNPGVQSVLGTLAANQIPNTGIPTTEFSIVSLAWNILANNPSAIDLVTPFAFTYLSGVTPFPTRGLSALNATLKTANVNVVGTGAEGGISNTIALYGTTMDGHDFTYWYSVDWVQINIDLAVSNAVINGSNNGQNPLYYNQAGINRLTTTVKQVMNNAIAFGLANATVTVTAVPFSTYVTNNPSNYTAGIYNGIAVSYTPNRGFVSITVYVNVTSFPAGG